MNCRNCAAPMELFDRRRYYFCRHCGTFEFLERGEVDGIRVLEQQAGALPCTRCAGRRSPRRSRRSARCPAL
jgi:hypothetical protein